MTWYKNYLAAEAQPWARQVQKEIDNLKANFQSAEVNNTTRDDQLASSLRQVQSAANDASAAAADAQQAADDALAAINGLTGLGSPGSPYEVDGANIVADSITANEINSGYVYAGQIDADQINAGTLTGFTIQTSSFGQRVEMSGSDIRFYNSSTQTGNIIGSNYSGSNSLSINNPSGVILLSPSGGTYAENGLVVTGTTIMQGISCSGVTSTGQITTTVSDIQAGGSLRRTQLIGGGTTGASITDGGNFVRTSSSQRYKTDIQPLTININDLYALEPKTFKRIEEVEEHGDAANVYPGFIAEELAGTSLDKFVFYSQDENGNKQPEGIHYPELTAALLLAVKELNQRIQTLEDKVK